MDGLDWISVDAVTKASPLLELLSEGVWILDAEARTASVNQHMANILGYTAAEMVGVPLVHFIPADQRESAACRLADRQQGRAERHESEFLTKTGTRCSAILTCSPISNERGEYAGAVVLVTDITERQRVEAEQQQTLERFEYALGSMSAGIWELNLADQAVYRSLQHDKIFGYQERQPSWTFETFLQHVLPEDRASIMEKRHQTLELQKEWHLDCRIRRVDGAVRWIASSGHIVLDQSGQPSRMIGVIRDVTDRMRAKNALEASDLRLRQALSASQTGIFDHDLLTGATYWSPELRDLFRLQPDEQPSMQYVWERHHPEDRAAIQAATRRAHDPSGDGSFDYDVRILHRDGSLAWHHVQSQTFFKSEGQNRCAVRTIGAVRDITERKEADELQSTLAALVERSQDFMGLANFEQRITYLNPAGRKMLGLDDWTPDKPLLIGDVLAPESIHKFQTEELPVLEARGSVRWQGEMKHCGTGERIPMEAQSLLMRDDAGAPVIHAAVIRDLRAQRESERVRATLEADLRQSQKLEALGRLAGGIAHNFNNSLAVILGATELLKLSNCSEGDLKTLNRIRNATHRARAVVRQLLEFSREQPFQPHPMNLNAVLQELKPEVALLLGAAIQVCEQPAADLWTIRLDAAQIEQVLLNLVTNARDAMPSGGRLTWQTSNVVISEADAPVSVLPGEYVAFRIIDTGIGMDRETQERIFEPFFTTKPKNSGTGLGLSTVQGIVHQNHGFIRVKSSPGLGTEITVYFPRAAVQDSVLEEHPTGGQSRPESVADKGCVLLVEGDEALRENTSELLNAFGYRILPAEGPLAALQLIQDKANHIDVVLSDVVMPEMRGTEFAHKLNEIRPGLPVLLMSGHPPGYRYEIG